MNSTLIGSSSRKNLGEGCDVTRHRRFLEVVPLLPPERKHLARPTLRVRAEVGGQRLRVIHAPILGFDLDQSNHLPDLHEGFVGAVPLSEERLKLLRIGIEIDDLPAKAMGEV